MKIYKLGTIWGKGAPDFYEMIKSEGISISHINDCNPKKDSIILITKGHTVKAITILLEDCHPVTENEKLEELFEEYDIDFNNETLVAKSKWIELKPEDYFLFQTQDGICQVHKPEIHQITKTLLYKYMEQKKLTNKIELLNYKNQIILQGPPGTGKTRMAKILAENIFEEELRKEITEDYFRKIIIKDFNYTLKSNGRNAKVKEIKQDVIILDIKINESENISFSFQDVFNCFQTKDYLSVDFVDYSKYAFRLGCLYSLY